MDYCQKLASIHGISLNAESLLEVIEDPGINLDLLVNFYLQITKFLNGGTATEMATEASKAYKSIQTEFGSLLAKQTQVTFANRQAKLGKSKKQLLMEEIESIDSDIDRFEIQVSRIQDKITEDEGKLDKLLQCHKSEKELQELMDRIDGEVAMLSTERNKLQIAVDSKHSDLLQSQLSFIKAPSLDLEDLWRQCPEGDQLSNDPTLSESFDSSRVKILSNVESAENTLPPTARSICLEVAPLRIQSNQRRHSTNFPAVSRAERCRAQQFETDRASVQICQSEGASAVGHPEGSSLHDGAHLRSILQRH
jgi:hypothetical protein